jgi:flagellar hook-associated protein 3 FlgL
MRVVPSELYTDLLSNLQVDQQNVNQAVEEASSGLSVNTLSDYPVAAGELVINRAQLADVDQFSYSVSTVQGSLNTADSALNSVVSSLTQAISVGTEAGGGTLSSSELQALAQQITQIQQQVVGLANTTYQGNYVFAGTAVTTQPYVSSATSPSGIKYVGNPNTNNVEVGEGQTATINLPGSQIFDASGADVFQSLTDLSNAIQSGNQNSVSSAISEVQSSLNNVIAQRSLYGDTLQQLNSDSTNLTQEQLTLQQFQTSLIGANAAQVATNLSQAQTTLQAAIEAVGQISQDSLLNYIK